MTDTIPPHIIDTINTLLAPYGRTYEPDVPVQSGKGFMQYTAAAKYLGVSRSTLRRFVEDGRIAPPFKLNAKNGVAVFAIADLDAFVHSVR